MKEYTRDSVEFVRIGYHDACINFVVKFREWSGSTERFTELKQAINAAGQYNEFEPSKVIRAIEQVCCFIDEIQFGREGSPVMYLRLISHIQDGEVWFKHSAKTLRRIENVIKKAFSKTMFDEWSREGNVIRVWWD
jgi:hypothetical protein